MMICSLGWSYSFLKNALAFVSEWQTVWVTGFTVLLAWYQWELTALIPKIETMVSKKNEPHSNLNDTEITILARRLSNLPACMAIRVFRAALYKATGNVIWKGGIEKFKAAHKGCKDNRKKLKEEKFTD